MSFRPRPNEIINIAETNYTFTEHPAAPGMAYGQAGRRGTVYQLADEKGGLWALKVFLSQYREPRLAGQAERLRPLAALPGLRAAERAVLTSSQHRGLIREHLDLAYAVQMPWISGRTWMEVILSKELLPPLESLQRAAALAAALVAMEERGLAHCDLSGPNLILPPEGGIELVDLEEMYGPELLKPEGLPGGSPGYAHKTAPQGLWNSRADRFSGAVLLAEMLGWCDERVLEAAWGEGYFQPEEMGEESERTRLLKQVLAERWGQGPAELFGRAWSADTLAMSPTFNEWAAVLPEEVTDAELDHTSSSNTSGVEHSAGDLSLQLVRAQRLVQEGNQTQALAAYHRILKTADPELRSELQGLIQSLEPESEPESGGTWSCPVCGKQAAAAASVCPHCEQGEQPASEIPGSPAKSTFQQTVPPGRNGQITTDHSISAAAGGRSGAGRFNLSWWQQAGLLALGVLLFDLLMDSFREAFPFFPGLYVVFLYNIFIPVLLGELIHLQDARFKYKHVAILVLLWLGIFGGLWIFRTMGVFYSIWSYFGVFEIFSFMQQFEAALSIFAQGLVLALCLRITGLFDKKRTFWTLTLGWFVVGFLQSWLNLAIEPYSMLKFLLQITFQSAFVFIMLQHLNEFGEMEMIPRSVKRLTWVSAALSFAPLGMYLFNRYGMDFYLVVGLPSIVLMGIYIADAEFKGDISPYPGLAMLIAGWNIPFLVQIMFSIFGSYVGLILTAILGSLSIAAAFWREHAVKRIFSWEIFFILVAWMAPFLCAGFQYSGYFTAFLEPLVYNHFIGIYLVSTMGIDLLFPAWVIAAVVSTSATFILLWEWSRRNQRRRFQDV